MHDFVETNLTESASNKQSHNRKFAVRDQIWLSILTAKNLTQSAGGIEGRL